MSNILRLPAMLVLFALALLSLAGAAAVGASLAGVQVGLPDLQSAAVNAGAADLTWLDVGLWAGAGLFFLIAGIRLIRRTQGFWAWLIALVLYAGRWAWAQQQTEGGLVGVIQGADFSLLTRPAELLADMSAPEAQVCLFAVMLVVGLLAFIVDAIDRAYWEEQAG